MLNNAEIIRKYGFMLAEDGDKTLLGSEGWLWQRKQDGERAQLILHTYSGRMKPIITLKNRRGTFINDEFPEFQEVELKAQSVVLDGEIYVPRNEGREGMPTTAGRINVQDKAKVRLLAKLYPAVFCAFDILYLNGEDLRGLKIEDRLAKLNEVIPAQSHVEIVETYTDGQMAWNMAEAGGWEGLMAKRLGSKYAEVRSGSWRKIKRWQECEKKIIGFTSDKRAVSALVLEDGGKVNFGVDDKTYRKYSDILKGAVREKAGEVFMVNVPLYAKIRFLSESGGKMRFPTLIGIEVV